jgi:Fe-S cluster biogenesis protein NfuA
MESFINCVTKDIGSKQVLRNVIAISDAYIPSGRCEMVRKFLATDCEWLWSLDYDISFEPDVLYKLLDAAHADDRPIVTAIYVANFKGEYRPCIMLKDGGVVSTDEFNDMKTWPKNFPLELHGAGMGCMMIHRSILEQIETAHAEDPWPWFGHDVVQMTDGTTERMGEDFTFGFRAIGQGGSIWAIPVTVGHNKTQILRP